jgi:hypothetical protein
VIAKAAASFKNEASVGDEMIVDELVSRFDHRPADICGRVRGHLHPVVCELCDPGLGIASID